MNIAELTNSFVKIFGLQENYLDALILTILAIFVITIPFLVYLIYKREKRKKKREKIKPFLTMRV